MRLLITETNYNYNVYFHFLHGIVHYYYYHYKIWGNLILYFFSSHIITKYKANNDAIVKYLDNFKLSELLSRTTPINSSFSSLF